jgi:uncharacterized protein
MSNKTTLVVGASENTERYAHRAILKLLEKKHTVYAEGLRPGQVNSIIISNQKIPYTDIHTVTLYVGPKNQESWIEYILSLKPKRIIFNPGTENEGFQKLAEVNNIETIDACTLVMLSIGNY